MELYPHQQTALEETRQYSRVAYYLDMGLGKTFVGSEKMRELNSPVNLIVCQKSKVEDWEKHMIENYAMDHCWIIYNLTDKKDFERFFKEVETRKSGDPTVCGIINYDLLFRRAEIAHLTGFTLMLDESSIIQNEGAKRSKFVLGLHPDNVILLSGTPTAGKYEKLWSQLHLLGWGISKDLFYKQYVTTEWMEDSQSGFRIKVVTGYKNVDRLKAKLAQHGAVFMKSEDVFTLPEQSFISVTSKIPGCYKKFMRDDVITIDGREYVGDTTLSKRIYARMMCSFLNRERVAAFVDLVHSTEDRLIVFYNFNEELNTMLEALTAYTGEMERPCSIINGEKNDLTAYDQYENSITFIQYQAGSMGVNLQKANKIIYFSLTDRSELFEQSKKRIHRIGQTQPCFYYQMICPGTVEEDILKALKMRKDYTDELFKAYQAAHHC